MATASRPHILLVGCGKMGGALLRSWLQANIVSHVSILEPGKLPVTDPRVSHLTTIKDDDYDMVVLAVKPQVMKEACAEIKPLIAATIPVLSIAAGQTIAALESYFHVGQPVIRAMPNLPAAIGEGITAAYANKKALPHQVIADQLFKAVGECVWLKDENQMDAVTAISGSGPAYVFYLIEALSEAAMKLGLPAAIAAQLARKTVTGSAALADVDSETPPAQLRENVTSKGGTTAAALSVLMDGRFQDLLNEATAKAAARSKELAQ